jgi:hypothetical protein
MDMTDRLPDEWRMWAAETLLAGVSPAVVARTLAGEAGVAPSRAATFVHTLRGSAALRAGERAAQRLRKLESLLDALETVRRAAPGAADVPRRRGLTGESFLAEHYATNRPVLLEDFAAGWPALGTWTPLTLRDRLGDELVEIMGGRDGDPRPEVNQERHRTTIRFADYVDVVTGAGESNNAYLVANNHFFDRPGTRPLLDEIVVDPGYFDPAVKEGNVFFWFGPAGTITPLHHDVENVMLVGVHGTKDVTLVSPLQSHRVYNLVLVYSEVDTADPDYARHPRFLGVQWSRVRLCAGEALFIPVGWWHRVEAAETSISVSLINFAFPNTFHWSLPELDPAADEETHHVTDVAR